MFERELNRKACGFMASPDDLSCRRARHMVIDMMVMVYRNNKSSVEGASMLGGYSQLLRADGRCWRVKTAWSLNVDGDIAPDVCGRGALVQALKVCRVTIISIKFSTTELWGNIQCVCLASQMSEMEGEVGDNSSSNESSLSASKREAGREHKGTV